MAQASIPVDPFNPGQVFACLGFMEAADILLGHAEGGFDWQSKDGDTRFVLKADGDENPFATVLEFLAEAEIVSLAPAGSSNDTEKWNIKQVSLPNDDPFPFPDPDSPATLPARLTTADGREIVIDHWGDGTIRRDRVKFWAGSGGYPGVALVRDARDLIKSSLDEQGWKVADAASDPFALSAVQSSSFRFDWRRDYIPIDAGFSPNDHKKIRMLGFPIVELLAAIGLTNARPQRLGILEYRYGIAGLEGSRLLSPIFLRAALGAGPAIPYAGNDAFLPLPRRTFHMQLGWPAQEGQARCILDVDEEIDP
ncbi:MAG: type I-U CRISPR-associated protein Cas8c [Rhodospirillales bacterium]|nr:type I-U CRISPR-associated protein Cas8c [Rhodospirillales bacterium]